MFIQLFFLNVITTSYIEFVYDYFYPYTYFVQDYCNAFVITVKKDNLVYSIYYNGRFITSCDDNSIIVIIEDIFLKIHRCVDNYCMLHGCAISYNNKAICFIGKTMSGKSTLVTYLLSKGFNYITDDRILLNIHTKNVYPYYRPIMLRESSIQLLKNKYDYNLYKSCKYFPLRRRYKYVANNIEKEMCMCKKIFYLDRQEEGNDIVSQTLTPNEKLLVIAKNLSYVSG